MKFRFGTSHRDDMVNKTFEVPGPGTYASLDKVGKEGKRYTLYGRPKTRKSNLTISPGPCAYNPKQEITEETTGKIRYYQRNYHQF
jgi:hypothetical protein